MIRMMFFFDLGHYAIVNSRRSHCKACADLKRVVWIFCWHRIEGVSIDRIVAFRCAKIYRTRKFSSMSMASAALASVLGLERYLPMNQVPSHPSGEFDTVRVCGILEGVVAISAVKVRWVTSPRLRIYSRSKRKDAIAK